MRLFVKIENDTPVQWGITPLQVRGMAPRGTMFPRDAAQYEEVDLREFGFQTFHRQAQPDFNPESHRCEELPPALVGDEWRQQWRVVALTADELAAAAAVKAAAQKVADHEQALTGDHMIRDLRGMTHAEFEAWWTANVTNAAQAIGVLKRVTRVVLRKL